MSAAGYVLLDLERAQAAYAAIGALPASARPSHCLRLLLLALLHVSEDGSIALSRSDIAATLGVRPDEVSVGMGVLERLGLVAREREPVKHARGLGSSVYRLLPAAGLMASGGASALASAALAPHGAMCALSGYPRPSTA